MRRPRSARALVVGAAVAALVCAAKGLAVGWQRLDDSRTYWSALAPGARDDQYPALNGLDTTTWENLRAAVRPHDRFAVIARGEGQYDIRNYAMYTLLPAVHTLDLAKATVIVYYGVRPPRGRRCVSLGKGVCLIRVGP